MGGRGSGGGRSGGGGSATQALNKNDNTKILSKQIDNVSKKVVSMEEFKNNYKFYDNLSDSDLTSAVKITQNKFQKANAKYSKMIDAFYLQNNYKVPTRKDNPNLYDKTSKEWKKYQRAEKALEKQSTKVESLERSLNNARIIMKKRNL